MRKVPMTMKLVFLGALLFFYTSPAWGSDVRCRPSRPDSSPCSPEAPCRCRIWYEPQPPPPTGSKVPVMPQISYTTCACDAGGVGKPVWTSFNKAGSLGPGPGPVGPPGTR
ncbi:uncharacterized protein LOC106177501 [Lingula anatina]|uniref:Uncharacterized protein LOC106177501 n=1 Tax=Lingula anatina TaxID=7574 RepID=A0A1S3JZC0_LINAN|nr:uncharacterized protein LOC106177501 [Lingula anatina]|eukprot:XP_013415743.1 uncharacterized protein LOC106177501 [Lingula anatina]